MSRQDPYAEFRRSQPAAQQADPYAEFRKTATVKEGIEAIRTRQTAKYPSSQELGNGGEAVTPESTTGTRLREAAIGLLEPLDVSQIPGSVAGIMRAAIESVERGGAGGLGRDIVTKAVPAVASAATYGPSEVFVGIREGDYDRAAHGAGAILGTLADVALGTKGGRLAASRALQSTARGVSKTSTAVVKAPGQISGAVKEAMLRTAARNPNKLMTVALKPRSINIRFTKDMDLALPEVKAIEVQLGRPIAGVQDLMEAVPLAKRKVRAQYDAIAGPQRMRGINGDPIADAMNRSIAGKLKLQNPQAVERIREVAATYRRTFTLEELEDFLKTTNAELESHYAKYPTAQRTQLARDPAVAFREAEARALRDTIYNSFDSPGMGSGPRELQRSYGSLMNLERETQRRLNVANRQQLDSLTQQIGKLAAAYEVGKAIPQALTDPAGALGRVTAAMAGRRAADIIREMNSADAQVEAVFKHYKRTPNPITSPAAIPASRQIARGSIPLGATPDPSGIQIIDAARGIARDPKTGRMFKYFKGTPQ